MSYFTYKEVSKYFPKHGERTYDKGQILFYQGDSPNLVYFVKKGAVKFYDIDVDGNERILGIKGKNAFFPVTYFLAGYQQVLGFYATLCKCHIITINREEFESKLKTDGVFSYHMAQWLGTELSYSNMRIKAFERNDSTHKIVETMNYLLRKHSKELKTGRFKVNFPINQQILANLTGLTRETVNTTLKELESTEAFEYPKFSRLIIEPKKFKKLLDKTRG